MPGVAVSAFTPTADLARVVHGVADLFTGEMLTASHLWDLASLTKGLVTLPEVLALVHDGALDLDTAIGEQWPPMRGMPAGPATLRQMLSYQAGLPASVTFYEQRHDRDALLAAARQTPLERPIGGTSLYSDIAMIILGQCVEDLRAHPLAELARARTGLLSPPVIGAVATEFCAWRGRLTVGEAHDENAWVIGGVAGHAGAFGTMDQVVEAVRSWWRCEVVDPDLDRQAVTEQASGIAREGYGLVWRLGDLGGPHPGPGSWGLSGFVGHRIWVEPSRGYGVVILSNRIHPHRGDRAPFNQWCDELQTLVLGSVRGSALAGVRTQQGGLRTGIRATG
jgi:CubicO group peptidase (beta-lactamase class C family)